MPTIHIPSCRPLAAGSKMPATYMQTYQMSASSMSTYEMQTTTCQQQNGGNNVLPITCQQIYVDIIRHCILGVGGWPQAFKVLPKAQNQRQRPEA